MEIELEGDRRAMRHKDALFSSEPAGAFPAERTPQLANVSAQIETCAPRPRKLLIDEWMDVRNLWIEFHLIKVALPMIQF